jgi:hypothetical protein
MSLWLLIVGCGDHRMPTSPDARLDSTAAPAMMATDGGSSTPPAQTSSSSSCCGTVKETLSGPPINGVTPQGLATADQSQFRSGGSTILTVTVKNVNLPDGTVLGVSIDFTPIGSITLAGGRGSLTANLGHFGVSRDQVRVHNGDTQILQGAFFR